MQREAKGRGGEFISGKREERTRVRGVNNTWEKRGETAQRADWLVIKRGASLR